MHPPTVNSCTCPTNGDDSVVEYGLGRVARLTLNQSRPIISNPTDHRPHRQPAAPIDALPVLPTVNMNQELAQLGLVDPHAPKAATTESFEVITGLNDLEDALLKAIGLDRARDEREQLELEEKNRRAKAISTTRKISTSILYDPTISRTPSLSAQVRSFVARGKIFHVLTCFLGVSANRVQRKCSSTGAIMSPTPYRSWNLLSGTTTIQRITSVEKL
jgi:hypothetical protein